MAPHLVIGRKLTQRPDRGYPEPWFQIGRKLLRNRRAFSRSVSEMPFDRAHNSRRRARRRANAQGRLVVLGEVLLTASSEWRARTANSSAATMRVVRIIYRA